MTSRQQNSMSLVDSVLAGSRLALSRLLSQIENETPEGMAALRTLFPHTGRAHLVGVTGAPGTGKSSLVNQLARHYRRPTEGAPERKTAVIAIDPSSPFTGGAILGDRIRMRDLAGDPGIFIRSMASRGSLGGLASATAGLAQVFDAAGYDVILIETVGAGQGEVDIARLAHTTLVVEAPGLGDEVQAIKAGILEIADILVINKADRPGVENTERALRSNLDLAHPTPRFFKDSRHQLDQGGEDKGEDKKEKMAAPSAFWSPPIKKTVSTEGVGIAEVLEQIDRHLEYLRQSGDWEVRERARLQADLETRVREMLFNRWRESLSAQEYSLTLNALYERRISPLEAAEKYTGLKR
jgi:LAO/AO transport system kinase